MGFISYPILCSKCKNKITKDELEDNEKMCGKCFFEECEYYEELERLELEQDELFEEMLREKEEREEK